MNLSNRRQRQINLFSQFKSAVLFGLFLALSVSGRVFAAEATSTTYQLLESSIQASGGFSTSSNFQIQGVIPFISSEAIASGTFQIGVGAVGFPAVVLSVNSGVAGPQYAEVTLTWTEAENLANPQYEVGQLNPGTGVYGYSAAQTTLTRTITNLSFAEYYYFIIRVKNGLGEVIGYSNVIRVLPQANPSGTGSGGGVSFSPEWQSFLTVQEAIASSGIIYAGEPEVDNTGSLSLLERMAEALKGLFSIFSKDEPADSPVVGGQGQSEDSLLPPASGGSIQLPTGGSSVSSSTAGDILEGIDIGKGSIKPDLSDSNVTKNAKSFELGEFLTFKTISFVVIAVIAVAAFIFLR